MPARGSTEKVRCPLFLPLGWNDDTDFVKTMIRAVGVSAVPGSSFHNPKDLGSKMVRFMFAKRDETLHEAGRRLQQLKEMMVPR